MPHGYYRYPTLHNDTVVFACEDDLWTVPVHGGVARRLTSNLGYTTSPFLAPDGVHLAFVGYEEGPPEIYVMPALGGPAQRLTFMGANQCQVIGWTPAGQLLFSSNAGQPFTSVACAYRVDLAGHAPQPLPFGPVSAIALGPTQGIVLGRNTGDPARWKRYRGGTAGQLWINHTLQTLTDLHGEFAPLIQLNGNLASPMWLASDHGARIYFLSDHEGIGNLYSCTPRGDDLRRHTQHSDFYARNATTDGQRIVYHAGADLYCYDPAGNSTGLIPVAFHSPQTQRNRKFVWPTRYLQDWALHPTGQAVAVTTRGKAYTFANWEGAVQEHAVAVQEAAHSVRYRLPQWLPNGRHLIAVSDAGGEEAFVYLHTNGYAPEPVLDDDEAPLDIGRPEHIAVNPHKPLVAFSNHRYELLCLDLEHHQLQVIDQGKTRPIAGFDWSPDGNWLVYSVSVSLQTAALKLWNVDDNRVYRLTQPVLRDVAPRFDPEGKYIYFLSYRYFDPVHDNLQFNYNFMEGMKPYLITLQKDTPSPFIPQTNVFAHPPVPDADNAEEPTPDAKEPAASISELALAELESAFNRSNTEANPEGNTEVVNESAVVESTDKADAPPTENTPPPLHIDLDGITQRIMAFPVDEGRYGRIIGIPDGKVLYSQYPVEGALNSREGPGQLPSATGVLFSYNFADREESTLHSGISDFDVSLNGKFLIYQAGGRLRVIKAGEKPPEKNHGANRKSGWLDLDRVTVEIDPGAEWRQMFREAWRLQRDHFWTSDMSQVDWLTVHDRYLVLVDRVSSRAEFSDLMWEMQGELGTSHAYELGGDYRAAPHYDLGLLGADFAYDAEREAWQITRIVHGDAWEPRNDSPLNTPGVNITEGDYLIAVNGRPFDATHLPQSALVNQAGNAITLTIAAQADVVAAADAAEDEASADDPANGAEPGAATRTVTVKPLASDMAARYREWVNVNRQRVHAATAGRVGYVHIPDMGARGFAEFHRGFLAEVDREGLIVDARYNGGGSVSPLILEKLARRRIGYDVSRWGQIPEPYPPESVWGPMVALTNEQAGSDGDIFSHGFKLMGLGPLIGKRTWGGVVGIWARHSLVDGTVTTQPEFSFWFCDVGWGVENYGTDPDIEVDNSPQDYANGVDAQLERAIVEVQKLLAANPPQLPDFSERPSKALPTLGKSKK